MAAARFPARIPPRSTPPRPMRHATSPRTPSPPSLPQTVAAAGLAWRCTLQLSYAIGISKPLSLYVDLHGTGEVAEARIEKTLGEVMDLSPRGIREHLGLNRPIYARTAAYGHFGR